MRRRWVNSQAIRSVGYDVEERTLEVEFSTGRVYRYRGVSPGAHAALMGAPSIGAYFNRHVRDSYPHEELTPA